MNHARPLASIPDDELLRRLAELSRHSRRVESELVAHIAEVEERRLYAREASPSMFSYCTRVLHLSEAEAYARITAARASLEHPMLLEMLVDGRLHLTAITRLAPHLTVANRVEVLERATHKSRRQIEELIADITPRPDAPALMRRLPERRDLAAPTVTPASEEALQARAHLEMGQQSMEGNGGFGGPQLCPDRVEPESRTLGPGSNLASVAPALETGDAIRQPATAFQAPTPSPRAAVVQPLGNARYKVQFTASAELHHKLERLRALMRARVPDGDLAAIIDRAVSEALERLESRRFARTSRPRTSLVDADTSPSSRRIPAAVRRAVYERDGGRCRYVDEAGRRCSECDRLEYHHRHPFGMGGDHGFSNIRLMCRAHNTLLAEHDYGREVAARGSRSWASVPRLAFAPATERPAAQTGAAGADP